MQRVSSPLAFLARCAGGDDAEAQQVLAELPASERHLLELLAREPDASERRRRLAEETGEAWSAARHERAEGLALSRLRRVLQQNDLLRA